MQTRVRLNCHITFPFDWANRAFFRQFTCAFGHFSILVWMYLACNCAFFLFQYIFHFIGTLGYDLIIWIDFFMNTILLRFFSISVCFFLANEQFQSKFYCYHHCILYGKIFSHFLKWLIFITPSFIFTCSNFHLLRNFNVLY